MDLLERNQRQIFCTDNGLKHGAVPQNIFPLVPVGEGKIQGRLAGREYAGAAAASAETMHQPGQLFEWGKLNNFQAAGVAERPRRGNSGTALGSRSGPASGAADA